MVEDSRQYFILADLFNEADCAEPRILFLFGPSRGDLFICSFCSYLGHMLGGRQASLSLLAPLPTLMPDHLIKSFSAVSMCKRVGSELPSESSDCSDSGCSANCAAYLLLLL